MLNILVVDILKPLKNQDLLHHGFKHLLSDTHAPARRMIIEQFDFFDDPDGNYIEQFQTTGFEARIFELFLNSYFHSNGFNIDRHSGVDFIIETAGFEVVVEATTSNPSTTKPPIMPKMEDIFNIPENEIKVIHQHLSDEMPIRLGSPLFSKLKKQYWKHERCANKPIVLAIESFHDGVSLLFSSHLLEEYLYGLKHYPTWTDDGKLIINADKLTEHHSRGKIIPSNFFLQPEAENISAVMFSNTGTLAKFNRMGYQSGYDIEGIELSRFGLMHDSNPNSASPALFSYDLSDGSHYETWGEGLVVILNPYAKHPLPTRFFPEVSCYSYLENGMATADTLPFHPYNSITIVAKVKETDQRTQ